MVSSTSFSHQTTECRSGVSGSRNESIAVGSEPRSSSEFGADGARQPARDGKELLRLSRRFARERRWRSWWHLVTTLAAIAVVVLPIICPAAWPLRLAASLVLGLLLVRLFVIYHDYEHGTLLRGSRLAGALMNCVGLLILAPPSIWRRSHDHHHRNNTKILGAAIGSYPVMTSANFAAASRQQRFAYAIARHPLTIAFGYLTVFIFGMCLRPFIQRPREHFDAALALLLHAGLVALLAVLAPSVLFFGLLLPIIIASALGAYLFYAQHNYPAVRLQTREKWDYVHAALHASSYIHMSPMMHWFTGNIGYHHVHHLNARIPFYRLPEAMASIAELQSPGTTSLAVGDVARCLRLKLWDEEQGRMVGYPS